MTNPTAESTSDPAELPVVAGVDTHADTHHVAVLSTTGARLGDRQIPTTTAGHEQLLTFVRAFGPIQLIGIEGTSSYGAGLSRYLIAHNVEIRERSSAPDEPHGDTGNLTQSTLTRQQARRWLNQNPSLWRRLATASSNKSVCS